MIMSSVGWTYKLLRNYDETTAYTTVMLEAFIFSQPDRDAIYWSILTV